MKTEISSTAYLQGVSEHVVAYLAQKLGSTGKDKFDAYVASGVLHPMFKCTGTGMVVGLFRYKAMLSFEALPASTINAHAIMARVLAWVADNDKARDKLKLPVPSVDIDAYNNSSLVDIEIEVEFAEEILATETDDAQCDIEYAGKRWNVTPYTVYTAEAAEVRPDGY